MRAVAILAAALLHLAALSLLIPRSPAPQARPAVAQDSPMVPRILALNLQATAQRESCLKVNDDAEHCEAFFLALMAEIKRLMDEMQ